MNINGDERTMNDCPVEPTQGVGKPASQERHPLVAVIVLSCDDRRAHDAVATVHAFDMDRDLRYDLRLTETVVSLNGKAVKKELPIGADLVLNNSTKFNYADHNNDAAKAVGTINGFETEYFCFLNDDVLVRPGWLEDMLECYRTMDACAVGMKLVYPEHIEPSHLAGRIQHCGVDRGPFGTGSHRGMGAHRSARPYCDPDFVETWSVTGACLLVKADDFWTYGPFDEGYKDQCQDTDLCQKLKAGTGRGCYVVQKNWCWHEEMATRGPVTTASLVTADGLNEDALHALQIRLEDNRRFMERWGA